jgi:hypothetical protein
MPRSYERLQAFNVLKYFADPAQFGGGFAQLARNPPVPFFLSQHKIRVILDRVLFANHSALDSTSCTQSDW